MSDTPFPAKALTLGEISKRLELPEHRVKYAITRFDIRPAGRVGILRFWTDSDVARIRNAIDAIAFRVGRDRSSAEGSACPRT